MTMNIHLGAPQIILLAVYFICDLIAISLHGKQAGTYNALWSVLLNIPMLAILYWGGFFSGGACG